jgi:TPR repeat protein
MRAGSGSRATLPEAEYWFAAAAKQDHPAGQLGLGMLYAGSYGERRDHERPRSGWSPARRPGNSTAQLCLAMLLLFGDVPRDEAAPQHCSRKRRKPASPPRCSIWESSTGAASASRRVPRRRRPGCVARPRAAI